ncbi:MULTISPECIES: hypothetical protein [unclassified Mesorhizobium]|uniref:hypothetical protein n=1 Tax=unclassified Mesorhizobium TaxID=325217 RepID=UPI001AECEBA7|nr:MULTISPECIES: hypothetical protein [unclassified Mesorhizobium]
MKRAVYARPNKPMRISIKHRDGFGKLQPIRVVEPVIVDKFTECHVTPDDVAARMVAYLGPQATSSR